MNGAGRVEKVTNCNWFRKEGKCVDKSNSAKTCCPMFRGKFQLEKEKHGAFAWRLVGLFEAWIYEEDKVIAARVMNTCSF